jgi:hypothetical protein
VAASAPFRMSDLAVAADFDVALARLSLAASDYKIAMTFDRGPSLLQAAGRIEPRLQQGVEELDQALARVVHPIDREQARALAEAVHTWPGLLRAAREELLARSGGPEGPASAALASADDAVAQALEAYRSFRAGWTIADAPDELPTVVTFLRARRTLEEAEGQIGRSLQQALAPGAAPPQVERVRAAMEREIGRAREAAGGVDEGRKAAAQRWVEAQARAVEALLKIAEPATAPEERGRQTLLYERAKLDALSAAADYTHLTAARAKKS